MQSAGRIAFLATALVAFGATANAADWPQWRGPFFNGSTDEQNLPVSWSLTEGLAWTAPMPGAGAGTPVIVGSRVFVSSTDAEKKGLFALCLDSATGKVLWRKEVGAAGGRNIPNNTMSSCSPVADAKRACFLFGTGALAAFDHDGNPLWTRDLAKDYGELSLKYGYSSSPLLHQDKLYALILRNVENKYSPSGATGLDSLLIALDAATGKELWKHVRPTDAKDESLEAYSTPILHEHAGRAEILVAGGDYLTGHNPDSGAEFWRFLYDVEQGNRCRTVPSPVAGEGLCYVVTPRGEPLYAVNAGGAGRIPTEQAAWVYNAGKTTDVCTPLLYRGRVYVLNDSRRVMTCLDAKTGEKKWAEPLAQNGIFRASPTGADGKVYCLSMEGNVVVLQAGDEFKVLARVAMGGKPAMSSVAVAGGRLFIRTADALYCVGQ